MRWIGILAICTLSVFLTGVSGCDSRMRYALFNYELSGCPEESVSLPSHVILKKWDLSAKNPPTACQDSSYYLMADEIARDGGGFGITKSAGFYAKVVHDKSCSVLVAFPFDVIAEENPRKNLSIYSKDAVTALFQDPIKAKLPEKSFAIIQTHDDFKKWCVDQPLEPKQD